MMKEGQTIISLDKANACLLKDGLNYFKLECYCKKTNQIYSIELTQLPNSLQDHFDSVTNLKEQIIYKLQNDMTFKQILVQEHILLFQIQIVINKKQEKKVKKQKIQLSLSQQIFQTQEQGKSHIQQFFKEVASLEQKKQMNKMNQEIKNLQLKNQIFEQSMNIFISKNTENQKKNHRQFQDINVILDFQKEKNKTFQSLNTEILNIKKYLDFCTLSEETGTNIVLRRPSLCLQSCLNQQQLKSWNKPILINTKIIIKLVSFGQTQMPLNFGCFNQKQKNKKLNFSGGNRDDCFGLTFCASSVSLWIDGKKEQIELGCKIKEGDLIFMEINKEENKFKYYVNKYTTEAKYFSFPKSMENVNIYPFIVLTGKGNIVEIF